MGAFRLIRRGHAPSGTYFEVYGARPLGTDRTLVLKRLLDRREGLPERMHEALRTFRGSGLPVAEVFRSTDGTWLGTDAPEGESLRWVMGTLARSSGFIAPNEGLALIARAAKSLELLHHATLFHGDVSPSSLFLTESGEVLLHDVGVASALGAQGDLGPYRAEMQYVSPEQLSDTPGPASDVFRLGLLLYELAMGRPLWPGPTPAHVCHAALSWQGLQRDTIKHVPEPWQSLLVTMLNPRPSERPGVSEVGRTLNEAIARNKWSATQQDVARLFSRAAQGREKLFDAGQATTQEVMLQSLSVTSSPSTVPTPELTPPSGAVFARINTKKMTREELTAVRTGSTQPGTEGLPADFRAAMALVQKGQLTRQQLETAQAVASAEGRPITSALVDAGADEDLVVSALSDATKTTSVSRKRVVEAVPGPEALALFPFELSRQAKALPLGLKGNQLMVAMIDPMDAQALALVKRASAGKSLVTFRAGEHALVEGRRRLYPDFTELELDRDRPVAVTPIKSGNSGFDMMAFVDTTSRPSSPGTSVPSPTHAMTAQSIELLMRQVGPRGAQAAELVALVVRLVTNAGLPTGEIELAHAAAVALTAVALNANRPPWDLPKLLEFQDELGFGTPAEPFLEALHAFPARMPERPVVKWVVLAFAFAMHSGEPRPANSRRAGVLDGFRARVQLPPPLFEALSASVV